MRRLPLFSVLLLSVILTGCFGSRSERLEVQGGSLTEDQRRQAMPPEEVRKLVEDFLDRVEAKVGQVCFQLDRTHGDGETRRATLRFRIRVAEICQSARHRHNSVVGLTEAWFWLTVADRFIAMPHAAEVYGAIVGELPGVLHQLRAEAEHTAQRALTDSQYTKLKADIDQLAASGDFMSASAVQNKQVVNEILSVTRLESVVGIALSPFETFGSVNKGADALGDLSGTASRAVDLAERYPQFIQWYFQLGVVDLMELDRTRQLLEDLHTTAQSADRLSRTAEQLPEKVRIESLRLLDESRPYQADARATLDQVRAAAAAIGGAGTTIGEAVQRLHEFVAAISAPGPVDPTAAPSEPFRIADYGTAGEKIGAAAKEIDQALRSLQGLIEDPATEARVRQLADRLDVAVAQAVRESDRILAQASTEAGALLAQARTQTDGAVHQARTEIDASIDRLGLWLAGLILLSGSVTIAVLRWGRRRA